MLVVLIVSWNASLVSALSRFVRSFGENVEMFAWLIFKFNDLPIEMCDFILYQNTVLQHILFVSRKLVGPSLG